MNKALRTIALCSMAISTFSGCSYNPAKTTAQYTLSSSIANEVTQSFAESSTQFISKTQKAWWQQFAMPELNSLLGELNDNNVSLEIARLRIQQSQQLLDQQTSQSWPSLNIGASHNSQRNYDTKKTTDSQNLGFTAAYEVDLWGSREAADYAAHLNINTEQQRFVQLSLQLQSQLSQQYFSHLALQQRFKIAAQNFKASQDLLDLIQLRHELGNASGIELDQQRNVLFDQRTQLITLQRDLALSEHGLAVLMGRQDTLKVSTNANITDAIIPEVQSLQPAALLETRPDIQLAELQLKQSDTNLFITKNKRWPNLSLSADLSHINFLNGGSGLASTLIGSIGAPLFDAGNIKAQVAAAEIETNIAGIYYRDTVINALRETVDTLSTVAHQKTLFDISEAELANNKRLYDSARARYDAGNVDFIYLLDAQRSWFSAQDKQINAKLSYLIAVVNTFKAMGQSPIISKT